MSGGVRRIFRLPFGRGRAARDLDEELRFHLEQRSQRLEASGMSAAEAQAEALRQFGDLAAIRQRVLRIDRGVDRAAFRARLVEECRQDAAYALRALRARPAFTAAVVLTLTLGIGANVAIFALIDALMLRDLPVPRAEQLVALGNTARVNSWSTGSAPRADIYSYPLYRDLRTRNHLVTGLAASGSPGQLDVRVAGASGSVSGGTEAEHPRGRLASDNYFAVLGVAAEAGRTFGTSDAGVEGAAPVVVIGWDYWQRRFGGTPNAVGGSIDINGSPFTIVGVMPRGFSGALVAQRTDIWIPLAMQHVIMPHDDRLHDRSTSWLLLVGRLAPGETLARARAGFAQLAHQAVVDALGASADSTTRARLARMPVPVSDGRRGFSSLREYYRGPLLTLMALVGLVLLIVCANVANLLLARGAARQRELAVRMALGAGRARLVRQLVTESLVLALAGGAAALAVAWWGSALLLRIATSGPAPVPLAVHLDARVLAFTAGAAVLTALLFGVLPALRATRTELSAALRTQGRGTAGSRLGAPGRRVGPGRLLVVSQVALSVLLLVTAGLLVRSVRNLWRADPGLARDHLLVVSVDAQRAGYSGARLAVLTRELIARLERVPGVRGATMSENGLFSGTESSSTVEIPGFVARADSDSVVNYDRVGPRYFGVIGAHLLRGRDFGAADGPHGAPVAIVNETMARYYFGVGDPIGRTVRMDSLGPRRIVGVVADVHDHELRGAATRRLYVPFLQPVSDAQLVLEVRTAGDPVALAPTVRTAVHDVDHALPIPSIDGLRSLMRESISEELLVSRIAAGFGIVALLLAAMGLYGIMSFMIARRTSELGLRLALGAEPRDLVRMVLGETLMLVAVGAVVGIPAAATGARLVRSQLYGVGVIDPVVVVASLLVLGGAAVAAGWGPARRAGRVGAMAALREE